MPPGRSLAVRMFAAGSILRAVSSCKSCSILLPRSTKRTAIGDRSLAGEQFRLRLSGVLEHSVELFVTAFAEHYLGLQGCQQEDAAVGALHQAHKSGRQAALIGADIALGDRQGGIADELSGGNVPVGRGTFDYFPPRIGKFDASRCANLAAFFISIGVANGGIVITSVMAGAFELEIYQLATCWPPDFPYSTAFSREH